MSRKPIPSMMAMKSMRTTHTKNHEPRLSILSLERLVASLAGWIRGTEPQHAEGTTRHLGGAIGAVETGC